MSRASAKSIVAIGLGLAAACVYGVAVTPEPPPGSVLASDV